MLAAENAETHGQVRVPMLPFGVNTAPRIVEQEAVVMKPEINVMSGDAVYLPMSESTDGHGMNIDFHAMAETVATNFRRIVVPVEQQAGIVKQVWGDMIDDVMGLKKTGPAA